jgi:deferrochelatase/peroxidase EfeB
MQLSDVDFADIQGLARFGHGHLPEARFHLLRIADAGAARAWLAARIKPEPGDADPALVTTAVKGKLPTAALQVAFTYGGLQALDVPDSALKRFSYEFMDGMAGETSRSRRRGDIGKNAPQSWRWGVADKLPHVLVLLYAGKGQLHGWEAKVKGVHWDAAFFELRPPLDTNEIGDKDNGDIEPFGFRDGLSQPALDWERRQPVRLVETRDYTNVAALGEFLLGYPNEYGRYTCRPLLDPQEPYAQFLPLAEDVPGKRDLGRNGSYLVMRDLEQDVRGFWHFLDKAANGVPGERRRLAHAIVGRMMSGDPLVPLSAKAIDGVGPEMGDVWYNQFTFHVDPDGTACPYGAHIRRANPRNADLPEGTRGPISRMIRRLGFCSSGPHDDLIASTRFHRILRRGREYGSWLKPDDALKPHDASQGAEREERGLRFICLNANISRQFEFVQTAWLANTKFEGADEGDPLVGNRAPHWAAGSSDTFTMPRESGLPWCLGPMSQFVTVRGGGYFFMPGISALRYLARTSA